MDKLISDIKNNSIEYGSIPFWSWNDKLKPEELKRQIRDMKAINMNGFFMHARSGLETEYLSDEWYKCINACIEEAKKLDMQAWSYDENGWPSGFAGGKLLKDEKNYVHWLEYKVLSSFDPEALAVYSLSDNKANRITEDSGEIEYHTIYRRADSSYIDTMNPRITKEFIELTHNDYKQKTGAEFGKTMPGFFTDEPQYYRWKTVWSDMLPDEFMKRYGYDLLDLLIALFINCEGADSYRFDYYKLCHELYIENFIHIIYDWCNENGAQLTGHTIEEKFLAGQMWCSGGVMPFYEYMTIPGIDYLGKSIGNDISSKQVGSVAAQLGKKKVLSEMFACCGWDVTPLELKRVAEHQYYGGVNLMCQHLYPYSLRGQRKRDYPAFYSEHQPWQKCLADFNEYFNRLGYLLSRGNEYANVLVIHPIHSAYMKFIRENAQLSIAELEDSFVRCTGCLSQNQIMYHYGDENLMKKYAKVDGSKIIVGNCSYDSVVLPLTYTLDSSTAELLKKFISNGGKLAAYGALPTCIDGREADMSWLVPNCTINDIYNDSEFNVRHNGIEAMDIRIMTRDFEDKRIYYILSLSKNPLDGVNFVLNSEKDLSILDLETLQMTGIETEKSDGKTSFVLDFEPVQSYIIIDEKSPVSEKHEIIPVKHSPFVSEDKLENTIILDYASLSYDGEKFTESRPIVRIKDNLLHDRYKGKIWLKYEFYLETIPSNLSTAIERINSQIVKVNGTEIKFGEKWWLDRNIASVDITKYLKLGDNEIICEIDYYQDDYVYYVLYGGVSESLRNCLNFDTEIEAIYLYGDFEVICDKDKFTSSNHDYLIYDGDFKLKASENSFELSDITETGYPFFSGSITLRADYLGEGTELYFRGVYPCAEVYVNGQFVKTLLFTQHCDISKFAKKTGDKIEVKVYQSNRNLLGPHHFVDCEAYAAPPTFSFEGQWNGGDCPVYKNSYSFKKFAIYANEEL